MEKLLQFQQKIGAISKDSTNPFFKSKYFDINKLLEEVKPVLNELGLILLQPLDHIDGKPALRTLLLDTEITDTKFSIYNCAVADFITPLPENSDPQKMGSIITYYRRYAIQSLLGLQAEDDDGNAGAKMPPKQHTNPNPEPTKYQKACLLIRKESPNIKTLDEYKEACMTLTGFELLPANYDTIINLLTK